MGGQYHEAAIAMLRGRQGSGAEGQQGVIQRRGVAMIGAGVSRCMMKKQRGEKKRDRGISCERHRLVRERVHVLLLSSSRFLCHLLELHAARC